MARIWATLERLHSASSGATSTDVYPSSANSGLNSAKLGHPLKVPHESPRQSKRNTTQRRALTAQGDGPVGRTMFMFDTRQGATPRQTQPRLEAFQAVPELVGAGVPFEALQIGNCISLGAYLGASALFFAEVVDRH